ncbi:LLM class flavin-dependent oxidoreductase [Nonomuraea jiangxiensis]|uniref:Luciferase-like monooxygenase n=1 Tax=Nonomuraea jiangxiensis TaxID=633440 RepID=A0A1G8K5W9_9ACTN|nr:LLM class flavin-dependent oxidoreductase [Nonomuraea jiangxiensis]SDI38811.1 Luciferase-like monooxygenase [Nonomuraea jiangxiensis]
MTVIGAIFRPQLPPERLRSVVTAAEEAGLAELWLWEDCFLESGIATAAAALAWTERLRIAIGVLPVPLRNVALTAMEVATLHRLFPGRVTVGVGHGVQQWMAQVGAGAESPLTLLREHLDALRALLRGQEVTTEGRYVRLDAVALGWPPHTPPAVVCAATGPRTLRLSGAAADGTVLHAGTPLDQVRQARRLIDEGRAEAGRTDRHPLIAYVQSGNGDPETVAGIARDRARAGADHVVLEPAGDEPDPEGFVRMAAEVGTLVGKD